MSDCILFAWELGDNLGHLTCDLALAIELRNRGYDPVFAIRDPRLGEQILTPAKLPFLPIPQSSRPIRLSEPPVNYSEVLIGNGYADRTLLSGLIHEWLQLLDLVKPNAVVIDHAPTALLASKIKSIPSVLLGSGFAIPPQCHPLPSIRPWEDVPLTRLLNADTIVLGILNDVLRTHRQQPLANVADIFSSSVTLLTTFPELDHYDSRSNHQYIGPIRTPSFGERIEWQSNCTPKVFAYLRSSMSCIEETLSALVSVGAEAICVIPDLDPKLAEKFSSPQLRLLATPVRMQSLLMAADFVVSYGGAGTIATSMLAGVPMLLLPQVVEQSLGARCVERIGAGIALPRNTEQSQIEAAIKTLLTKNNHRGCALQFAERYRQFDRYQSVQKAADIVGQMSAGSLVP